MHAIARLSLHPLITNIQTSWVKMGHAGAAECLNSGCNDLGGTLMNESISRAAGAAHGQEASPEKLHELIRAAGRTPKQRNTFYGDVSQERVITGMKAAPCETIRNTPIEKRALKRTRPAA
jgi:FO synthase